MLPEFLRPYAAFIYTIVIVAMAAVTTWLGLGVNLITDPTGFMIWTAVVTIMFGVLVLGVAALPPSSDSDKAHAAAGNLAQAIWSRMSHALVPARSRGGRGQH